MAVASFAESLEDFGPAVQVGSLTAEDGGGDDAFAVSEDATQEPEPVVSLHPDELERIKNEAFAQGQEQGKAHAQHELSEQMAASVQKLLSFMEEEEACRAALLKQMSDMFVEGVCQVVGLLVSGDLSQTTLRRDLGRDVAALGERCAGELHLSCAEANAPALKNALKHIKGAQLKVEKEQKAGRVMMSSSTSSITLDQAVWAKTVRQRVIAAVRALIHLNQQTAQVKERNHGG